MVFNFAFLTSNVQQAQLAQTNPSSLLCMQKSHAFHQHLLFRFVDKVFSVSAPFRVPCSRGICLVGRVHEPQCRRASLSNLAPRCLQCTLVTSQCTLVHQSALWRHQCTTDSNERGVMDWLGDTLAGYCTVVWPGQRRYR